MKYLRIIILLFVTVSCNKQEFTDSAKFFIHDFAETQYLKGKELSFDKELLRPVRLYIIDSVLVFQNNNVETHFDKYNIYTKNKIGNCISFGSGPEEMLNPKGIYQRDSIVWVCDMNRRKMMGYLKEQFCYSNMPKSLYSINFKEQFNQVELTNKNIVSTVLSPTHRRLSFFNMKGDFMKSVGDFPDYGIKLTPIETIESFLCNISVNEQDGGLCLSYNRTDLIEFYTADGTLKKRIHGPDHFFPVVVEGKKGNGVGIHSVEGQTRDGYFSPVVSQNRIFLLYSGRVFDLKNINSLYLVNQIFVFDWEGNPLKRYVLDIPIFWFTVDEKQNKIYGLTDAPDYRVIEFQF